jgi:hypothetical protein
MARTISTIQKTIQDSLVSEMAAIGINIDTTQWSKRNIMRLWCFIVAAAIALLEQLMDAFTVQMNTLAAEAVPGTPAWVQAQVFKFQYSITTPYQIQLINLTPKYAIIDLTAQIITRCSVKTDLAGNVNIKVAKGNPPGALAVGELAALQSYMNEIAYAGINYNCISQNADEVMVAANIYYKGQYNAVIAQNVINAINDFLADLAFDGAMKISDLENTIREVVGVNDII